MTRRPPADMPSSSTPNRRLRVLLTNDDGRPSPKTGHSPFIYPFARGLVEQLGWDVRVVVPDSQKSWVGKSYLIGDKVTGQYCASIRALECRQIRDELSALSMYAVQTILQERMEPKAC